MVQKWVRGGCIECWQSVNDAAGEPAYVGCGYSNVCHRWVQPGWARSINKIRSLSDVAACRRLRELYVRKNEIGDLRELRHLRRLPALTSLWLDENPCTRHPQYRLTVLRNLPRLEKLDNVPVHPDEVQEAMRRGAHIPDSDEEEEDGQEEGEGEAEQEQEQYSPQESYAECRRAASCESSPDRQAERSYRPAAPAPPAPPAHHYEHPHPRSPPRRAAAPSPPGAPHDERHDHPAMTRSHYEARSPDAGCGPLRHSYSAQSVKDYSYSANGDCRYGGGEVRGGGGGGGGGGGEVTSPQPYQQYHEPCCDRDRAERWEGYSASAEPWERGGDRGAEGGGGSAARGYRSAVMGERRGFTRRPVGRNSNLLSAVLCLVKELDYPSLEVAEMAVRCRMDELANSQ